MAKPIQDALTRGAEPGVLLHDRAVTRDSDLKMITNRALRRRRRRTSSFSFRAHDPKGMQRDGEIDGRAVGDEFAQVTEELHLLCARDAA